MIQQARSQQRQQQLQTIQQRQKNQGVVRIGDRDVTTGNYEVRYQDGGRSPNGIKVYNVDEPAGTPVFATPRKDGMVGLDSLKAKPLQRRGIFAPVAQVYEKCIGYLNGQIYNCKHPDNYRKVQVLYSLIDGENRQFWVGAFRRQPVLVCSIPATETIHLAAIHNRGKDRWIVSIEYGNPKKMRRCEPGINEFDSPLTEFMTFLGQGFWSSDRNPAVNTGFEGNNFTASSTEPGVTVTAIGQAITQTQNTGTGVQTNRTDDFGYTAEFVNPVFQQNTEFPTGRKTYEVTGSLTSFTPNTTPGDTGSSNSDSTVSTKLVRDVALSPQESINLTNESSTTSSAESQGVFNGSSYVVESSSSQTDQTTSSQEWSGVSGDGAVIYYVTTTQTVSSQTFVNGSQSSTSESSLQAELYWINGGNAFLLARRSEAFSIPYNPTGNLLGTDYYELSTYDQNSGLAAITQYALPSQQRLELTETAYPIPIENIQIHASSYHP